VDLEGKMSFRFQPSGSQDHSYLILKRGEERHWFLNLLPSFHWSLECTGVLSLRCCPARQSYRCSTRYPAERHRNRKDKWLPGESGSGHGLGGKKCD
jgi:hypothetical protein